MHTDLFQSFTEKEERYLLDPDILSSQSSGNRKMRCKVLDWLIGVVNDYYRQTSPTELLAMSSMILNVFLEKQELKRSQYQLLGIMALQIASKYELRLPMKLDTCVYLCADTYTKEECLGMEQTILSVLDYNVTLPTSHTFLSIFFDIDKSSDAITKLSLYLLIKILPVYKMLNYKPSITASAILYFSKKFLETAPYWSQELRRLTNYQVRDFQCCLRDIKQIEAIDFDALHTKLKLEDGIEF
jgi:hypothetical protein